MQLLEWWNLIFELPFLAAFIIVLVMATGAAPMSGAGGHAHHEIHIGHSVDVGHGIHMGHSLGLGHGVHHDMHGAGHAADHAAQAGHHGSWNFTRFFTMLGIGRVPMAVILMSLSVIWGFVGWTSNLILSEILTRPKVFVPISVVLAFISAVVFTRYLALGFSRLIPSEETYGVTRDRLVGKTGEARYPISETFGEALVRDRYGQLHLVSCRTMPGKEAIPAGSKVVLYEFDSDQDLFYVVTETQFLILTSQYAPRPGKEA